MLGGRYHHEEIVYSRSKVNKQKREGALVMMTTRLVQAIPVHLYHVYTRCITCVVTGETVGSCGPHLLASGKESAAVCTRMLKDLICLFYKWEMMVMMMLILT